SLFVPLSFYSDISSSQTCALSLHDALPICVPDSNRVCARFIAVSAIWRRARAAFSVASASDSSLRGVRLSTSTSSAPDSTTSPRSEEHTSELQSRENLVCRLLLEKKNSQFE